MSDVYRPPYYVNRKTGKLCKRKDPDAVLKRSKTWRARWYTPDGGRRSKKGYRDKKATEALAAEMERRAAREHVGLIDPLEEQAKKPLAEHAADYVRYLAAKGSTADYVNMTASRLTKLLDDCRFVRIGDIQASAVVEFVAGLKEAGRSVKTANDYVAAVKGFTRWLWRDKRTGVDMLVSLSKLPHTEADLRHPRRDYLPEELARLFETARTSKRLVRDLAGIDRYALYLTASATGFRVSELASMTPESFDLDGDMPTATVRAACTKNRKVAIQPLPKDVAQILRDYLRDKPADQPVWPGKWQDRAYVLIKADLKAARKIWLQSCQDRGKRDEMAQGDFLVYMDSQGRYADFHALRHSFITMVGKMGVSPKEHQDLARHSTYALTSRYSHSRFYDLAAAVQSLPIPTTRPDQEASALAATGTDGRSNPLSPNLSPPRGAEGVKLAQIGIDDDGSSPTRKPGKHTETLHFPGSGEEGQKTTTADWQPVLWASCASRNLSRRKRHPGKRGHRQRSYPGPNDWFGRTLSRGALRRPR
jgi:integrase